MAFKIPRLEITSPWLTALISTETDNKDNDHSIVIIIRMMNVVNYIDKKEE